MSLRPGVYRGEATVSLAAQGTGPVTIVFEWFLGNQQGAYSVPDGTDTVVVQAGALAPVVQAHTFTRGRGCYGGVRVTTKPAAANGSASDSQYLLRCQEAPTR